MEKILTNSKKFLETIYSILNLIIDKSQVPSAKFPKNIKKRIETNIIESTISKDSNAEDKNLHAPVINFDKSGDFEFLTTPVIIKESDIRKKLASSAIISAKTIKYIKDYLQKLKKSKLEEANDEKKPISLSEKQTNSSSSSFGKKKFLDQLFKQISEQRKPFFSYPVDEIVYKFNFFAFFFCIVFTHFFFRFFLL